MRNSSGVDSLACDGYRTVTNTKIKYCLIILILILQQHIIYSDSSYLPVILFLGDSLTAGYGIGKEHAYPALIEKKIRDANSQARVINAGISGNTTAGGLRRLNWYFRQRIDVLVIALGGNDGLRGTDPEESKRNLEKIIDRARDTYPDIRIVLAGMLVPPNMGVSYSQRFREIFPELASEKDVTLVPFLLEGVGGIKGLNLPDGIHPNAQGQKIICKNIWRVLKPLLSN